MKLAVIPENENARMADLLSLNLTTSDKKVQFDRIVMILSKCLDVPIAYISSIGSTQQNIHASCGLHFQSSDRSTSFCGHTILQTETLIVEDTLKDPRFFDNPQVIKDPKIRFYAGFPLTSLSGNGIGALCIADRTPRKLSETQRSIFETIGNLLVERIRMYKLGDLQKQINVSQEKLKKVNQRLNQSNQFYQQLFGQYMSEALLKTLVEDKKNTKLGGEERYATVLMSDLRRFTPMSEKYGADTIVNILNIYLEKMITIIHKHEGFINEILGDGILVIFGAPNDLENCAQRAIECAREMQAGLLEVNKELKAKKLPSLEMGIGINSGFLVAGNIGSKKRMKYGVVGETVNIAARIEAHTIAGQILISETTYDIVKDWVVYIGKIRVKIKGITDHITIYDVSMDV